MLPNADVSATRLMVWRDSKGLPLFGPTRRHVHQPRNAEATRKGSIDGRLDDIQSKESEGKSHAGGSFTDAFAGGDRLDPRRPCRISFRRAIAAPWRRRKGASSSLRPGSASPRSSTRSKAGSPRACVGRSAATKGSWSLWRGRQNLRGTGFVKSKLSQIRNSSTLNLWRRDKRQPADGLPT